MTLLMTSFAYEDMDPTGNATRPGCAIFLTLYSEDEKGIEDAVL